MGGFFDSAKEEVVLPADISSSRNLLHQYNSIIRENETTLVQTVVISEAEILDRSKGDAMAKFIVVLQTIWFIAQYLGRWAGHLPRTQLEVITLAYATLAIAVYLLWWHKPLNVQLPIEVSKGPNSPSNIHYPGVRLLDWRRLPTSWKTDRMLVFIVAPGIAVVFGGIHCLAWTFPFPTPKEMLLWRICAIFVTLAPIVFSSITYFGTSYTYLANEVKLKEAGMVDWIIVLLLAAYFASRGILLVITFTSLRSSPPGVYQALSWSSYVPHLG